MRNTLKRITAAVIVASTLAVSMVGMSANAAVSSYNWATRHVVGAPGSASSSDACNLSYATYGAKSKMHRFKSFKCKCKRMDVDRMSRIKCLYGSHKNILWLSNCLYT